MERKEDVSMAYQNGPAKEGPYGPLRRDIIELRLKPGMTISIKALYTYYDSSRSPMRDALLRLEQEGLVMLLPQRGIMISRIDLKRAEEERFLRVSVEREVMKIFMRQHNQADIDNLEDSLQEQEKCISTRNLRAFLDADDDFHNKFYCAVNKFWCAKTIDSVSGHYRRFRLLSIIKQSICKEILSQHREMVEAIKKDDEQKLMALFNHHLTKMEKEGPEFLHKFPDLFQDMEGKQFDSLNLDFLASLVTNSKSE